MSVHPSLLLKLYKLSSQLLKRDIPMVLNVFSSNDLPSDRTPITSLSSLPSLPSPSNSNSIVFEGPTDSSHWVVPSIVCCGASPRSAADVRKLVRGGVTAFICLRKEWTFEEYQRYEYPKALLKDKKYSSKPPIYFVHFPVEDFSVNPDKEVLVLIDYLIQLIRRGEVLYIHCFGGHGRTGTIVSLLLATLYGVSTKTATAAMVFTHKSRRSCWGTCHLPEVQSQHLQLQRLSWHTGRRNAALHH
eukprot:TRINITY_DN7268_c0_g1_i1.p1 TRINITY_DN7268_c0_g1~~TRINITY_DN7268_c0_g1_i1.p1  ORF type:complete len:245 (+),score=32.12 TRINITY_DN7268_c0_g1_i1:211-945(+)